MSQFNLDNVTIYCTKPSELDTTALISVSSSAVSPVSLCLLGYLDIALVGCLVCDWSTIICVYFVALVTLVGCLVSVIGRRSFVCILLPW